MAAKGVLHFLITNCPGPFRVVSGWVHMLEQHGNRLVFDLTLKPVELGVELLGHERKFKIPFEVALMGATTKYGHHIDEPRNVRMLGRFWITDELQRDGIGGLPRLVSCEKAAPELDAWQWEVVFNAGGDRTGFVAKLGQPLPQNWTL